MKKYSLLILSFVISIIIFSILIVVEKNINQKDELNKVYILNKDIEIYSLLDDSYIDEIYIENSLLNNYNFISNKEEFLNKYSKYNLKKGEFLTNKLLVTSDELDKVKKENTNENIAIKLDNLSSIYSDIITNKTTIDLYITINEKYLPLDIQNFSNITQNKDGNNIVTFKYLDNITPISFVDENGNQVNGETTFSSIILNVTNSQAIYLNSISSMANFKVTIN